MKSWTIRIDINEWEYIVTDRNMENTKQKQYFFIFFIIFDNIRALTVITFIIFGRKMSCNWGEILVYRLEKLSFIINNRVHRKI